MATLVQCPNPDCQTRCSLVESHNARTVRCPKCGKPFSVKPTIHDQRGDTRKSQPASSNNPFPVLPAEFGRFRLLKLLGRGGMGAVYLAEDPPLGRKVALKVPFFDPSESHVRIERFLREARLAAALDHPNICTFLDAGEIDGRPFLTMAYIAGTRLTRAIDAEKPMPQVRAAEIVHKLALALEHAHGKQIIHRDLKPANVILTPSGEPVVLDFGLAKQVGGTNPNEPILTLMGAVLGTPSYMAPEQVRGNLEAIGPATDIYALGVILFELLTGRPPYTGPLNVIMGQTLAAPIPTVKIYRPDVDARLDAICRKALAKKPADRFASAAEVVTVLGYYLRAPISAAPPPPAVKAPVNDAQDPPPNASEEQTSPLASPPLASPPPRPASRMTGQRRLLIASLVAALLLLVPLVVFGIIQLFAETTYGTLVVEIDPDAVDHMHDGRLILSGSDGQARYTLPANVHSQKVEAGSWKIRMEGADGLVVDVPEVTIREGGQATIHIRRHRTSDPPG
jgi:eukaryotic-like serine/threonine-protein kinase